MSTKIIPVNLGFVKSFLVVGSRVIVVDAGMPGSMKHILNAMKDNCIRYDDVSLILITHAHGDHMGGLWELKDMLHAPVAVHRSEAQFMANGTGTPAVLHSPMMKMLSVFMKGSKPKAVQPDVLIDDKLDLTGYGVDATVLHTPGHTPGSVTLVTSGGDAIVGDMVGGLHRPELPGVYADLVQMKRSIGLLETTGARMVYTSHGNNHAIASVLQLGK